MCLLMVAMYLYVFFDGYCKEHEQIHGNEPQSVILLLGDDKIEIEHKREECYSGHVHKIEFHTVLF